MILPGTQHVDAAGRLLIGGCDAAGLGRSFGTPLYVLDEAGLRETCRAYREAFAARRPATHVAYACKAFATGAMLRLVIEEGLGLDVVSEGELDLALRAGAHPRSITVHGNYKTTAELERAVTVGVGHIVIDSLEEIEALAAVAARLGRRPCVLVRVNPGVDVDAGPGYTTAAPLSKFGLSLTDGSAAAAVDRIRAIPALVLDGLHFHLGSQIATPDPYLTAMDRVAAFLPLTHGWRPRRVVIGGGMAAWYEPDRRPPTPRDWAAALVPAFAQRLAPHCTEGAVLGIEPGRAIAAAHGVTLYTIGVVKPTGVADPAAFVTVDGGLSDNPRPIMYGVRHEVVAAADARGAATGVVEVCGRHCETDTLFAHVPLPSVCPGDVLAVQSTGAYTQSMASNYNRYARPAVVFARDGRARVVVRRETLADLVRTEADVARPVHAERRAGARQREVLV